MDERWGLLYEDGTLSVLRDGTDREGARREADDTHALIVRVRYTVLGMIGERHALH